MKLCPIHRTSLFLSDGWESVELHADVLFCSTYDLVSYQGESTMTPKTASELSLVEAIPLPALDSNPKQARAAIKRCCAAWQRVYDAYMEGTRGSGADAITAAHEAGPAFCKAMPPLAGYESIRDFVACAAHGILIDAIPEKRANQLLYAAQVALATLRYEPKSLKSA
jgi:hypothetical protein